ncbi:hypothetical protein D3C73_1459100 [compost metagenome]
MTLFTDRRRQAVDPHRSAVEFLDHGQQQTAVLVIEATLIDIQQVQGKIGNRLGNVALAAYFGKIAHPAQQAVGDSRRATGATGNFKSAVRIQRQA